MRKVIHFWLQALPVLLFSMVAPLLTGRAPAYAAGMAYRAWQAGVFSGADSDATISLVLRPLGVRWLAVAVPCFQESTSSTTIAADPNRTPTDADIMHVVAYAHGQGMKVLLKPHVDLPVGESRTAIGSHFTNAQFAAWFASYTAFINHYATLAGTTGADQFAVGTELEGTSQRAGDWRTIVAGVRARYAGPITYAANFDEESVGWWDAVDAIGVDAYYPLTDHPDPTLAELESAWAPIARRLAALSARWGKQVIFTEAGYQPLRGTNMTPSGTAGTAYDPTEQANCYRALLATFVGQPWWGGVFWWEVVPIPDQRQAQPRDWTPVYRPAGEVMRAFFTA